MISRGSVWRPATILPAVLTAIAGAAAVAVVSTGTPGSRPASFSDRSPLGVLEHLPVRDGGMRAVGWDFDPDAKTTPLWTGARVDGKGVTGMRSDLTRTDVAAQYPKAGAEHGFAFHFPVPEGTHHVCLVARNIAEGSNYHLGCVDRVFDYGPVGRLERLRAVPGHIYAKGWTLDRDDPTAPVATRITIDGVAADVVANKYRPDVAKTHPRAGADHGFEVSLAAKQGTHNVCVRTINIGPGTNNSFGCRTVTLNDNPKGVLEFAGQRSGRLKVGGWAFDGDAPTTPLTVKIKVDDTVNTTTADVARADVAKLYPVAGQNHGYWAAYTVPEGSHTVCVTIRNIGYGTNTAFPCRTVVVNFTPTAAITTLTGTDTGARVTGWATDPDTTAPVSVQINADGHKVATLTADDAGATHDGHNFTSAVPLTSGSHTVCAIAINASYGTHNSKPACRALTLALRPFGRFESLRRGTLSSNIVARGWTIDPDTTGPVTVNVRLDGAYYGSVPANAPRTDIAADYPQYGSNHGLSAVVKADDGEHVVCLRAINVGGGSDRWLGCRLIIAVHPVPPSAPQDITAVAGYGGAEVAWTAPASDGGAPWTQYRIVASPGGASLTVDPDTTRATVLGLEPSTTYTFTVQAINVAGASTAGTSPSVKTQASPPAQTTPAPVSTSRYIRNIRGASDTEQATMRHEGATDAYYNPSGHGYLILLDIGGQDQYNGGVVLSATTRFVTYADLVTDLKAYVDGYHSKQRASAPVTIALGTNNDMDVNSTTGRIWATKVVDPVAAYTRNHYSGITIAGANDIEPGFRASYSATKAWLTGYLANTRTPFVFNGSADGCSWSAINQGCNNGWRMSGLYYLAAGAAPARLLNLPQIYNTTMASQWKYISLTGVSAGDPRINFGGTLTEWTACDQTNSCGSLTGHTAWSTMWTNLQSDARLKVASLPYSTDLRIDR